MKISWRSLGLIGLLGGVGGAINAWLCYAKFPVPIGEDPALSWHAIPAGGVHGSLLALVCVGLPVLLENERLLIRLIGVPLVGWCAGFISWIPLNASLGFGWSHYVERGWDILWWPFPYFGLVGVVYALLVLLAEEFIANHRRIAYPIICSVSGVLGSLLWWMGWKPWWFAVLHGAIWGLLVGFGVWKSQQSFEGSS